jgi:hypothetical protein
MDVLKILHRQEKELLQEVKRVRRAINVLSNKKTRRRRKMSAQTRRKMRAAAKARWAKRKQKAE